MTNTQVIKHLLLFGMLIGMAGRSWGQEADAEEWPGSNSVSRSDKAGQGLTDDSSGITYQPPSATKPTKSGYLWIVKNKPPTLFKMELDGDVYINVETDGWKNGKKLKYGNGRGKPDAEGVTRAFESDDAVYVATEKNGGCLARVLEWLGRRRRLSILRYDMKKKSKKESVLEASHEWNLEADIRKAGVKKVGRNKGWEAITWIPNDFLTPAGSLDGADRLYDPKKYDRGGLFLVGLEQNGHVYAYELKGDGEFTRIAEFDTGWDHVVGLEFDRSNGDLWATCDKDCSAANPGVFVNELKVFKVSSVDSKLEFEEKHTYKKPDDLKHSNYEGIALGLECVSMSSQKFFWVDDDSKDGTTISQGEVNCPHP